MDLIKSTNNNQEWLCLYKSINYPSEIKNSPQNVNIRPQKVNISPEIIFILQKSKQIYKFTLPLSPNPLAC